MAPYSPASVIQVSETPEIQSYFNYDIILHPSLS